MGCFVVFTYFLLSLVSTTNADNVFLPTNDPTKLWYFWVVLSIIGAGGLFIIIGTCIRLICKKPPEPTFPGSHFEVAVVDGNNESNVPPYPLHLPNQLPPQFFTVGMSSPFSPPPYNLFSLENPPQYDEALKMPTDKWLTAAIVPIAQEVPGVTHGDVAPEQARPLETEFGADGQVDCGRMEENSTWESQEGVVWQEEDPPEYQLYDPFAEENLSEVSLTEHSPTCCPVDDPRLVREHTELDPSL